MPSTGALHQWLNSGVNRKETEAKANLRITLVVVGQHSEGGEEVPTRAEVVASDCARARRKSRARPRKLSALMDKTWHTTRSRSNNNAEIGMLMHSLCCASLPAGSELCLICSQRAKVTSTACVRQTGSEVTACACVRQIGTGVTACARQARTGLTARARQIRSELRGAVWRDDGGTTDIGLVDGATWPQNMQ